MLKNDKNKGIFTGGNMHMIHPGSNKDDSAEELLFSNVEQDELFDETIDAFDEVMDKDYDDGISRSKINDQFEEEADDEDDLMDENEGSDEDPPDFYMPGYEDELDDYDELDD